jgi:hypothetical protein
MVSQGPWRETDIDLRSEDFVSLIGVQGLKWFSKEPDPTRWRWDESVVMAWLNGRAGNRSHRQLRVGTYKKGLFGNRRLVVDGTYRAWKIGRISWEGPSPSTSRYPSGPTLWADQFLLEDGTCAQRGDGSAGPAVRIDLGLDASAAATVAGLSCPV